MKLLKNKIYYLIGLVLSLIISIGIGYFVVNLQSEGQIYNSMKNNNVDKNLNPSNEDKKFDHIANVEKQTGALNYLDLSIGALSIDDTEEKVYKVLGQPTTIKNEDYGIRLKYDNLEVVIRQKKISAFVCSTNSLSTPRGIHSGSTLQEVLKEYGTNYIDSRYDDLVLYEYKINSKEDHMCYLRFAIHESNNTVDYISIRFVE